MRGGAALDGWRVPHSGPTLCQGIHPDNAESCGMNFAAVWMRVPRAGRYLLAKSMAPRNIRHSFIHDLQLRAMISPPECEGSGDGGKQDRGRPQPPGAEAHPGQPCRHGGLDCHRRNLLARLQRCGQRQYPTASSLCRHPAAPASRRSRHAAAGHRAFARHCRHAAAAASGQAKARTGASEGWQRHRHRRHRHLLSTGWVSPMSHHPLRPNPQLLRPARSPSPCWIPCAIRSPTAAPQSGAPLCPAACTTSRGFVPFGCGSRRPTTRSTPRVSASALPHLASALDDMPAQALRFARWQARTGTGRGTGCAGSYPLGHRPRSDFAASGRCGRAARPAAACRASIRSPGGCPESAKSTRFWPTPMRWPFMPWSSRASDTPTLHDSTS